MNVLKIQMNTPPHVTRDVEIELMHGVSGKVIKTTPFLDGTVSLRNMEAGPWRLRVKHPNQMHPLIDKDIKVLPDRPTFVPLTVPTDLFSYGEIKNLPEANLGPAQSKLAHAAADAESQGRKRAGDPIYADDWNALAGTIEDASRATGELSRLVSPLHHDHPEIVARMEEIQANLQKFYDVFASTLARIQRQIQVLALKEQVNGALDDAEVTDPGKRREVLDTLKDLEDARGDNPLTYSHAMRRTGEKLGTKIAEIAATSPDAGSKATVVVLGGTSATMASLVPVQTYESELKHHKKVEDSAGGSSLDKALSHSRRG